MPILRLEPRLFSLTLCIIYLFELDKIQRMKSFKMNSKVISLMKKQFILFLSLTTISMALSASDKDQLRLEGITDNGMFMISLYPEKGNAPIGDHHNWVIEVKDNDGEIVKDALFNISGGMEAHGHGLPSQPIVTKYLGEGHYLIEGMLFNMAGDWSLFVIVQQGDKGDRKQFDMTLAF